jgi:hypothetical protein
LRIAGRRIRRLRPGSCCLIALLSIP